MITKYVIIASLVTCGLFGGYAYWKDYQNKKLIEDKATLQVNIQTLNQTINNLNSTVDEVKRLREIDAEVYEAALAEEKERIGRLNQALGDLRKLREDDKDAKEYLDTVVPMSVSCSLWPIKCKADDGGEGSGGDVTTGAVPSTDS